MHFSSIISLSAVVASIAAAPFKFPLPDGFPNPSSEQIAAIQKKAGGSLPNGPLPSALEPNGITALQLLAHNEIFEVAYFTSLLNNITSEVEGYGHEHFAPLTKDEVIKIFETIVNQEELHAAGINAALKNAGQAPVEPCEYQFPTTSLIDAITLANTFTDVVLGTLPQAQAVFAADGGDETPLPILFGSVIAQEGEQNGFFRLGQKKTPSSAPFKTGGAPPFAWSALNQNFIVPNSCPQPVSNVKIPIFKPLTVVTKMPTPETTTLEFAVDGDVDAGAESIVYISGQNVPLTVKISDVSKVDGMTHFKADFPFQSAGFANGLTIAALVKGTESFESNIAVAEATLNGPGLIEID